MGSRDAMDRASAGGPESGRSEWARGWVVVLAAFMGNGLGFNFFLVTSSLFVIPMQEALGLPRTAVMISPVAFLLVSFLTPIAARHVDRHGPRGPAIAGMGVLAIAYIVLASLPAAPAIYYATVALFVMAGTVTSGMVFYKGVSMMFSRQVGIALGISQSGLSLILALVTPMLTAIIAQYGWRSGYFFCAGLAGLVGLPVLLAGFRPSDPRTGGNATSSSKDAGEIDTRQVLRSPEFWLLAFVVSCGSLSLGGYTSHLYPILVAGHLSNATAAAILSVYALSIGAGRIVVGFLLDQFPPVAVSVTCMILTAVGAATLYGAVTGMIPHSAAFIAAILLGWGHSAFANFMAFFTLRRFGSQAFATIFSWLNIFLGSFVAIGGLIFAYSFDTLRNYDLAMLATTALWVCAAAATMFCRLPRSGD